MGWTAPRTWVVGEIVTKAIMDTHVKNNLRYLKGLDGVPTIESGLIIDNAGGDEYLQIPSLTTTERDALTPVNGMVIYNETTTEFNKYEAGAWKDFGSGVDHGGLDGLGDDDHTIYQKEDLLTTQGDIPYATAASTWARLAKGAAGQFFRMNVGATAPEWVNGAFNNKLLSHTRTLDAADGDVSYTGYGFRPTALIILAGFGGGAPLSVGFGDVNLAEMCLYNAPPSAAEWTRFTISTNTIVYMQTSTGNYAVAVLKTLDADGFTLTWTKTGTPTPGAATFIVFAMG